MSLCRMFFYKKICRNNPWAQEDIFYILFGIFRFKKTSLGGKDLRLLGIRIFVQKIQCHYKITKFFGITFYRQNLQKKLLKKIFKKIPKQFKDIYIIRHNIGESYIYLTHLKAWISANKSKKPLLVIWQKKYKSFYKMFADKQIAMKYIDIKQNDIQSALDSEIIHYKGRTIFCPTPNIGNAINSLFEKDEKTNFYSYICKDFNLTKKANIQKPKNSYKTDSLINNKIKKHIKLPFVIILPFAKSLSELSEDFWTRLVSEFKKKGYDVFINGNTTTLSERLKENTVNFKTDLSEIFALAKKSSGIIGLASGLSVFLTASNRPMDLIYTQFKVFEPQISSGQVMKLYSVHHLPNVKENVREYDIQKYSESQLINKIIKNYKKQ